MASQIKCIFLSEFHDTQGPIISQQVPDNLISKEVFDAIHFFVITKPELQNRLITLTSFGYKFVGCPIYIGSDKYKRNALIFNVCFTFDTETDTSNFGPVVKKLADYMTQLEKELGFLSHPKTPTQISDFLLRVLNGLNQEGCCTIDIADFCTVHLKLASSAHEAITVEDHDVPVLTVKKDVIMKYQWDLTTHQILHYVDGISHVLKIAVEADVELNLVKEDLKNLVHYRFLKMVPIFQYSNVYTVTRDINKLMEDCRLQQDCLKFVAKTEQSLPSLRDVFMLYCAFTPGTTVKDICTRVKTPHMLNIDERKLVQFGIMNKLLRCMRKYPIAISTHQVTPRVQPLTEWLDGKHDFDQICCESGLSHHELDETIENDDNVLICWK